MRCKVQPIIKVLTEANKRKHSEKVHAL